MFLKDIIVERKIINTMGQAMGLSKNEENQLLGLHFGGRSRKRKHVSMMRMMAPTVPIVSRRRGIAQMPFGI